MCGAEKVRHMLMGEQVLKKWKKVKNDRGFWWNLVMSVVIGGCGGREDAKKEH